jgi:ATP-dependent transcriptional regulator
MARPKKTDKPYFSNRLVKKLREALSSRSLVIEAPSGYGKTTAAQTYLREHLPGDAIWMRHFCAEESPSAAWRRFSGAIKTIDEKTGVKLAALGPPDEDSVGDAASLLREIECSIPTWLVLDDFHHIAPLAAVSVWKAFLGHDSDNLRLAIITRPLESSIMHYEKAGYVYLSADDLSLTEAESRDYFAQAGIELNDENAEELQRRTGGWMIALTLYLRHWRDKGTFAPASTLEGLLKDVIWDDLDSVGRDFLIRLSPFDFFSRPQASFMSNPPELPEETIIALQHNALLKFDAGTGLYYPHSTLLDFTRKEFACLSSITQNEILNSAGEWCAEIGDWEGAIQFFYRVRDFEKIFSLNLAGMEGDRLFDMSSLVYSKLLKEIAANCTKEMKIKHPLTSLQFTFELFTNGCLEEFAVMFDDLSEVIETEPLLAPQRNYLQGELTLIEAFGHYNNIAEMGRHMQRSSELTGGKTALVVVDNSWTFGNVSVLFMYHREVGRLSGECSDMAAYCPYYFAMAEGHGAGAPDLMQAETLLYQGEIEQVEIFGHRARNEASMRSQASILIGAEFLLARAALLKGDAAALFSHLGKLSQVAADFPQKTNRSAADLAKSFIMSLLGRPADMALWLRGEQADFIKKRLFVPAMPYAEMCRASYLLLSGQPEILLAESEPALGLAEALNYPLALIYGHLHKAAAWIRLGDMPAAQKSMLTAVDLAQPDKLLMPFAENFNLLKPLIGRLPSGPALFLNRALALSGMLGNGIDMVIRSHYSRPNLFRLSIREFEAASLMAEGLSYDEIAQKLHISTNTVKSHLKAAYRKIGTSSRQELKKKLHS